MRRQLEVYEKRVIYFFTLSLFELLVRARIATERSRDRKRERPRSPAAFLKMSRVGDYGVASDVFCDNMKTIISKTNSAFLSVAKSDTLSTVASPHHTISR